MESTPKIFITADEITLVKGLGAPLQLTASGYLYEFDGRNYNAWFSVGLEDKVRPGQNAPLHTVNVGTYGLKAIAHFTSQAEAEKLVTSITARLREGRLTSKIRPRFFSALEICAYALVVGLLGSIAAKVGWSLDLPFMTSPSSVVANSVYDQQINSKQKTITQAMTSAYMSAKQSENSGDHKLQLQEAVKILSNLPIASPDNQIDAPVEPVVGK